MFTLKKSPFYVVALLLIAATFLSSASTALAALKSTFIASGSWTSISSSGDGNKVVLVNQSSNDYVWFYTRSGESGFIQRKDAPSTQWSDVAMSRDGLVTVAVGLNGGPRVSTDSGDSWNDITTGLPVGVPWRSVALSGDGSSMVLASDEHVFISSNSGTTWATSTATGSGNWFDVAMSDDGSVIAATKNSGSAYLSTDSGASWNAISEVGSGFWRGASVSTDGSTIMIGSSNDYLWYSRDSGSTWSSTSDTNGSNYYVRASDDGEKMVSFGLLSSTYASLDGGQAWTARSPFQSWRGVSPISSDGSTFYALTSASVLRFKWGIPTISIVSPTNFSVIGEGEWNPSVSFDNPDSGSVCEYQINELPRQQVDCGTVSLGDTILEDDLVNGDYTLSIFLEENGEATSTSVAFTYNDVTPPSVSLYEDFMSPGYSVKTSNWNPSVSWGNATLCEYAFDEESFQAVDCENSGSDIPAPSIGQHTLSVRGTDENGNDATVTSEIFTVSDGYLYWYSTGDTDWFNAGNWYTDSNHTVSAGDVPSQQNDMDARLLGPVAPVFDVSLVDWSTYYPIDSIDSTGLTGEALERGVSFVNTQQEESGYIGVRANRVTGNASFGTGVDMGSIEVTGDAYVETLYYGSISGSTFTVSNSSWGASVGGTMYGPDDQEITLFLFDNYSNDEDAVVPANARFINEAYNYGEVRGDAEFIDSALGYGTLVRGSVSASGDSWVDTSLLEYVVIEGDLDVYSPVNLPFRATVGGTTTFHGYPGGLYFYIPDSWEGDYDWNEPDLWWTGPDLSQNAGRIPNSSDDVVILSQVNDDSGGSTVTVANLLVINTTFYIDVTVTGLATFRNNAQLNGSTLTGNALFEDNSQMYGTIAGNAEFLSNSESDGIIEGNAIFNDSSNDGTVQGNAEFRGADADNGGTIEGNVDLYYPVELPFDGGDVYGTITYHGYPDNGSYFSDYQTGDGDWNNLANWWTDATLSTNDTFIPGPNDDVIIVQSDLSDNSGAPVSVRSAEFIDSYNRIDFTVAEGAVFTGYSQNQGTLFGDIIFRDNASNSSTVEGSAEFYDSAANYGTVTGNATFVGENAYSNGNVGGAKIRRITSNTSYGFEFDYQGPWTVVADGARFDLTNSDYDETTLFIARNGGSFVPEVAPSLAISSPVASSTISSWSPVVSWGNATACSYQFDGGSFSSVDCSRSGSDIASPASGSRTLSLLASNETGSSTLSVSFSFSGSSGGSQQDAPSQAIRPSSGGNSARRAANTASFSPVTVVSPAVNRVVSVDRGVLARLIQALLGAGAPASVTVNGLVIPLNLIPTASLAPVAEPESLVSCPDMQVGSTGSCVRLLQRYLNAAGFTVASSGPGSSGSETTTFGPATRSALASFQQSKGIAPAEGYFGARTRAAIGTSR